MKTPALNTLRRAGYSLLEVVASAGFVAVGMAGAVSLSTSMMAQEDLSWRVAVARNYQENLGRLWQLGLTPNEVMTLIPSAAGNSKLSEVIGATPPTLTPTGTVNEDLMGVMESAVCDLTVSTANVAGAGAAGTNQITVYRPTLR